MYMYIIFAYFHFPKTISLQLGQKYLLVVISLKYSNYRFLENLWIKNASLALVVNVAS